MVTLEIKIYQDGNQMCAMLNTGHNDDNVQDGYCGFGDTPYDAIRALVVDLEDKEYFRADDK